MNADCHYGDHRYGTGAECLDCGHVNGGLLQWFAVEKARAEGRHHGNHFHRTVAAAEACNHPTHPEAPCADAGGCLHHEASDTFMATLDRSDSTTGDERG